MRGTIGGQVRVLLEAATNEALEAGQINAHQALANALERHNSGEKTLGLEEARKLVGLTFGRHNMARGQPTHACY